MCLSVHWRWFLRHVKFVMGVWGIAGTGSARVCSIPSFTQFSHNFAQFWLFQPFLGQFQHIWYQNAWTRAEKFHGDTVTHFHALPHTISCNFHAISHNFGYFSHFWANFNMLGIKMHVLELRNSLVILSKNFTHVFTQFHTILAISAIFGPISTCWVS